MKRYLALLLICSSAWADPASDLAHAKALQKVYDKVHAVVAENPVMGEPENYGDLLMYWQCWYSYTDPQLANLRFTCSMLSVESAQLIFDEFGNK